MPSPDDSFLLFAAGVALLYLELLRRGLYVAGSLGAALLITGVYYLSQYSLSVPSLELAGLAALLFVSESIWNMRFVASGLGTVLICMALTGLIPAPNVISPKLVIPICFLFGSITTYLARVTRVARQNKWIH